MKQLNITKDFLSLPPSRRKRGPDESHYAKLLSAESKKSHKRPKTAPIPAPESDSLARFAKVRLKTLEIPLVTYEPPSLSLQPFEYSFQLEREIIRRGRVESGQLSAPTGSQNDDPMDVDESYDTQRQGHKGVLAQVEEQGDTRAGKEEGSEVVVTSGESKENNNIDAAKVVRVCKHEVSVTKIVASDGADDGNQPHETVELVHAILSLKHAKFVRPISVPTRSNRLLVDCTTIDKGQKNEEVNNAGSTVDLTQSSEESESEENKEVETEREKPPEENEGGLFHGSSEPADGPVGENEAVSDEPEDKPVKPSTQLKGVSESTGSFVTKKVDCEASVETEKSCEDQVPEVDERVDCLRSLKSLEDFPELRNLVSERVQEECGQVISQASGLSSKVKELEEMIADVRRRSVESERGLQEEVKTLRSNLDCMENMHSLTLKESGSLEKTVKALTDQLTESQHKSAELAEMTRLSICRVAGAENEAFRLQKSLQDEHARRKLLFQQTINFRGKLLECIDNTTRTFRHVEARVAHVQQKLSRAEKLREEAGKKLTEHLKAKRKEAKTRRQQCVICLSAPTELVLVPCGHKSLCTKCGPRVKACPICRQNIRLKVKAYDTGYSDIKA